MESQTALILWISVISFCFFVYRYENYVTRTIFLARSEVYDARKEYTLQIEEEYLSLRQEFFSSFQEEGVSVDLAKHLWSQKPEVKKILELRRGHVKSLINLGTIHSSRYGKTRYDYIDDLPTDELDDVVFDLRMKYMLFGREKRPLIFIPMYVRHEVFMLSYFGNDLLRRIPT